MMLKMVGFLFLFSHTGYIIYSFIYLLTDNLGGFPILTIMTNAAVNMGVSEDVYFFNMLFSFPPYI